MISATAMPSNPFSRNSRPATSTTRARFSAACSRLTFNAFSPSALDKLYDIHHQYTNHDRYHITGGGLETEVRQRRATSKPQWFRRPAPLEPTRHFPMADFDARPLLMTETASVWDVACRGACKHRSDEEYVAATHLVFTYRGVYVTTWVARRPWLKPTRPSSSTRMNRTGLATLSRVVMPAFRSPPVLRFCSSWRLNTIS